MRFFRHLRLHLLAGAFCVATGFFAAAQDEDSTPPPPLQVLISVADQRLVLLRDGGVIAKYPISTSRYGMGDSWGSYKTPVGKLRVYNKIGDDFLPGAVIKHRSATGEVLAPNAPGRDPIVTRVIWLEGTEEQNANARGRGIYIHGTPEESTIGRPVSYGCIRMRSEDVIALYNQLPVGTEVNIVADHLPHLHKYRPPPPTPPPGEESEPTGVSGLIAKLIPHKDVKQTSTASPEAPAPVPVAAATEKPTQEKPIQEKPAPVAARSAAIAEKPAVTSEKSAPAAPTPAPAKIAMRRSPAPVFHENSDDEGGKSSSSSSSSDEARRMMQGSILFTGLPPASPKN
ncbi:MAG TPA: L,D-transpeptidase [Chthoniobacteraceae bacterium]|nr:L,D-transpeptidase [Chthoniobacteraceae bacterium]